MLLLARVLASIALGAGTCPAAIPGDRVADDAALQACLDKGGRVALESGSPGYLLAKGLVLKVGGTQLTSAHQADKARLVAHPDLFAPMLRVADNTTGYSLTHIAFDGNKAKRRRAKDCKGYRGFGSNIQPRGSNYLLLDVESAGALCGSAIEGDGTDFEIAGCRVHDNGRSADEAKGVDQPWADGITIWRCERGYIHDNKITDSTDVALIIGGGSGCRVEGNTIEQKDAYAFAGLYVWNFGGGNGDHAGSVYRGNTITAAKNKLTYGIAVGAHLWDTKLGVSDAGTVTGNTSRGAVVNLAIDGVSKGAVTGNTLSGAQGDRGMGTCRKSADYTAAHYGNTTIDPGAVARTYHDGGCRDAKPANGAVFVKQRVPGRLSAGEAARAALTFRNTGSATWRAKDGFQLGAQSPRDNATFRLGRVYLGAGAVVKPGDTYTFTIPFKAPSRGGYYTFTWRMVREHVEWFGQPSKPIPIAVR